MGTRWGEEGFKDDNKSGNVAAWPGGTETVRFPSTFSSTLLGKKLLLAESTDGHRRGQT